MRESERHITLYVAIANGNCIFSFLAGNLHDSPKARLEALAHHLGVMAVTIRMLGARLRYSIKVINAVTAVYECAFMAPGEV